jgi:hypothetical protein
MKNALREMIATWGSHAGDMPTFNGVPDVRAELEMPAVEVCNCGTCQACMGGCPECGTQLLGDDCQICGYNNALGCPECGGMMDEDVCDECGYSEGVGCSECGGTMYEDVCENCGYSHALSEGKKKKTAKKPERNNQQKIS